MGGSTFEIEMNAPEVVIQQEAGTVCSYYSQRKRDSRFLGTDPGSQGVAETSLVALLVMDDLVMASILSLGFAL